MSFSVYEIVVPTMVHGMNMLSDYLRHGQALEYANGMSSGSVLAAKLAPDMLSFGEQFEVACNKVDLHLAMLLQRDRPAPQTICMEFEPLNERVLETRRFLEGLKPEDLAAAQTHTYEPTPPVLWGWFGGNDYIRFFVLPNFFFHIAMAHALLRHLGSPVDKRDYLGHLTPQSDGYG